MQNEIVKSNTEIKTRDIEVVTSEIKELCRQAQNMALAYAIEIGRRLCEAKSVLRHGGWGEWLEKEVNFSQSTANNFMKLFEEYGNEQITIFGAVSNSQTIGNLPYSKALQLLAVPSDERENFAKEVDAENISVRELKEAIKERNEAIEQAKIAKAREDELREKFENAQFAKEETEKMALEVAEYKNKVSLLEEDLKKAQEKIKAAKEKLKKAESDPKIPPETLKKIRAEVEESVKIESQKENEELLSELKNKAAEAQEQLEAAKRSEEIAREQLLQAEKKLKTASPEVTTFKTLLDSMVETAKKLHLQIEKIRENDSETADKLTAALKSFAQML